MQDKVDLQLTETEKGKITSVLAGLTGFNANDCFHQVGDQFFFIPETIAGTDNSGRALAAETLVKYVLSHP